MAESGTRRRRKGRGDQQQKKRFRREPKWKQELKEIEEVVSKYEDINPQEVAQFTDLPLSTQTLEGLRKCGYVTPTVIQKAAITAALQGKDVLGAAKTGSGKTLAFLIPVLELLWRQRWSSLDGLGALIISPTRELAYQSFEVLRQVGARHDFSAGLVIGGKDLKQERDRIVRTNILICTPGRLLQHMDETPDFYCSSLKLLVLDEADRILDLGFQDTMNSVIENLPEERQTLLFSATQTKSVKDLARLSLVEPEYISVHEHSESSTPQRLAQSYIVCDLPDKLAYLFSFLRNHVNSKTIVFMSSCKQVKFCYEVFCRLRPGVPLMALYGRQKQQRRVGVYDDFCAKKSAVLFCTDIAARGLDFPAVHWVVQLDCPEDASTYIHRAGRTARYQKNGKALLFLLPSEEEAMIKELETRKVPIEKIRVNPKKTISIQKKLSEYCVQSAAIKHWAQRSFICYLKSVHLQKNKQIFNVTKLPVMEYALSLGLPQAPRVRFLKSSSVKAKKHCADPVTGKSKPEEEEDEEEAEEEEEEEVEDESGSDGDDVLTVKRVILPKRKPVLPAPPSGGADVACDATATKKRKASSKTGVTKKLLNKKIKLNKHVQFDEQGSGEEQEKQEEEEEEEEEEEVDIEPVSMDSIPKDVLPSSVGRLDIDRAKRTMVARDKLDRQRERERVKEIHRQRKLKLRKQRGLLQEEEEKEDREGSSVFDSNVQSNGLEDAEELALHFLHSH